MTDEAGRAEAISVRLGAVRERIDRACARAKRSPDEVRLLVVSKKHEAEAIRACYAAGQREFGENYVQELVAKADVLTDLPDLRLRLIGHLQRNKVKDVVRVGAAVDTVDSMRLAESIAERAEAVGRRVEVLVQVNVGDEAQKSGAPVSELSELIARIRALPALSLRGLLAIPPAVSDPEQSRPYFRRLRELASEHALAEVSMGMSDDLEVAIEEGATVVRVGTAILGARG